MARLFIGLAIPDEAALRIRLSSRKFRESIEERLPRHRWHITLFFLGEIADWERYRETLLEPIASTFVPTVRLTHLGRGLAKGQLWVYVEPNPQLSHLHRTIKRRVRASGMPMAGSNHERPFVPHIHVANLKKGEAAMPLPDWPLLTTFSAREAYIFESATVEGERKYEPVGTLQLVAHAKEKA